MCAFRHSSGGPKCLRWVWWIHALLFKGQYFLLHRRFDPQATSPSRATQDHGWGSPGTVQEEPPLTCHPAAGEVGATCPSGWISPFLKYWETFAAHGSLAPSCDPRYGMVPVGRAPACAGGASGTAVAGAVQSPWVQGLWSCHRSLLSSGASVQMWVNPWFLGLG